ncbi:MAG TPA: helix-turn-helix domain-containing protein, partial [Actinomycetota bacterium]|nr:helix-turn-helix domain-containing protein [Actinomycetota bacterium]
MSLFHLSRTFRTVTGRSLTWYRRQLRLRRALERLEAGDRDLAGLAADAGSPTSHTSRGRCEPTPPSLR